MTEIIFHQVTVVVQFFVSPNNETQNAKAAAQ